MSYLEIVKRASREPEKEPEQPTSNIPAQTACPGPEYCAGCYSVGVVDGRERFVHPPKGRQWLH
jgi:hypothetical protein